MSEWLKGKSTYVIIELIMSIPKTFITIATFILIFVFVSWPFSIPLPEVLVADINSNWVLAQEGGGFGGYEGADFGGGVDGGGGSDWSSYLGIALTVLSLVLALLGMFQQQSCGGIYNTSYGTCSSGAVFYKFENAEFLDIFMEDPPSADDFRANPSDYDRASIIWRSLDARSNPPFISYIEVEDVTGLTRAGIGGGSGGDGTVVYTSPATVCDTSIQTDSLYLRYGGTYRARILGGGCHGDGFCGRSPADTQYKVPTPFSIFSKIENGKYLAGSVFSLLGGGDEDFEFTPPPGCSKSEAATLEFTVPSLPDINVDLKANGKDVMEEELVGHPVTLSWSSDYADFCTFGEKPVIDIISATYAANCPSGIPVDCTFEAEDQCDSLESCNYLHDYGGICPRYDPCFGTVKNISILYTCGSGTLTAYNSRADYGPTYIDCPEQILPLEGSRVVTPTIGNEKYTLTCTGPGHQFTPEPKQKSFSSTVINNAHATTTVFDFGPEMVEGTLVLDSFRTRFLWRWEESGIATWFSGSQDFIPGSNGAGAHFLHDDGRHGVSGPACFSAGENNPNAYDYCMSVLDSEWDSDSKKLTVEWQHHNDRNIQTRTVPPQTVDYSGLAPGVTGSVTLPGFLAPIPELYFKVAPRGRSIAADYVDFASLPVGSTAPPASGPPLINRFDIETPLPLDIGDNMDFVWESENTEYCRVETVVVPLSGPSEPIFDFSINASSSVSLIKGGAGAVQNISAELLSGSTQFVSYTLSGLPDGINVLFRPVFCALPCSTKLYISYPSECACVRWDEEGTCMSTTCDITPELAVANEYNVTITATAAKIKRYFNFNLTIYEYRQPLPAPVPPPESSPGDGSV